MKPKNDGKLNVVTLCRGGCCPTMEVIGEDVKITDDFKGLVVLKPEEMDKLAVSWLKHRTNVEFDT